MYPVLNCWRLTKFLDGSRRIFHSRFSLTILARWFSKSSSEKNIILMGPPGAGKTTVGKMLADRLGIPAVDIDNDVLEPLWKMSVADKLSKVGEELFLVEEGAATCNFTASGTIISLTGSNPLHIGAMQHLRRTGIILYLDVDREDIIQRLSRMNVSRIVGQRDGVSIRDILQYRQKFYNQYFDIRVLCGMGDTEEEVADKALNALRRYNQPNGETFVSTRSSRMAADMVSCDPKYFSDVIIEGLAPDGGLYIPQKACPWLDQREWMRLVHVSYAERAAVLLEKCIHHVDIPATELRKMIDKAYGESFSCVRSVPVKPLMDNQYIQELFHGPTASFKDISLQLMPQLFAHCLPQMCNYLILVATSGDTGSAVLDGFSKLSTEDRHRIGVLVFFPERGISEIQKLQMTRFRRGNARAIGVGGDFDFCQNSIKRMFADRGLCGHLAVEYGTVLSTANSINWGRLLPQIVYHASAYLDLVQDGVIGFGDPIDVCIPTGNFGNIMSAIYAKYMGIPIRKFICASNCNRVLTDFFTSGLYDLRDRPLVVSNSPAIDILKSSNLERYIFHATDGNGKLVRDLFYNLETKRFFQVQPELLHRMQEDILAGSCSEAECMATIRQVHAKTGYVLDTHTATAKAIVDRLQDRTCPVVIASTAHHAKFAPAVLQALQQDSPRTAQEQIELLRSMGFRPFMHQPLQGCLRDSGLQTYTICQADFRELCEQVEMMIQDSFLNKD